MLKYTSGVNMRVCKISDLHGGEILAKTVMTPEYKMLLLDGTILKKEYIDKLKEFGILQVYIKENVDTWESILKVELEEEVRKKVRNVLEKHIYSKNEELIELCKAADNIIDSILEEEEVAEKIYDIKESENDIYEHSITVCSLSILTALKMKLPYERIRDIGVACLLHDLGIRYITIDYKNRDINSMTEVKISEYKKHPIYGYSVLKNESWISELSKNIILFHHECMNGSGYPLKTMDIPLEARIVAVCEKFDELICGIGYEKIKVHEAIHHLKQYSNILYDRTVVDLFLEFTAVYPAGTYVKTDEGEIGVIIRQNKKCTDKPVIKIILDKNGDRVWQDVFKDLSKETICITEVVEMIQ